MNTLIVIIGEPDPEGVNVDYSQLESIREKAISASGSESVGRAINKYAPRLSAVMVKDFDSLYADLKTLC